MKTRRIIVASLSMTILFAAVPTAGVCLADDVVTVDAENSASEKYTLKELDFSDVLGIEGAEIWSVTKTDINTYILCGGFPHEYIRKNVDGTEYTEEGLAQYFAVVDAKGDFIIPWFESDYGGRGGRYLTYTDGVYNLVNPDTGAPWNEYLEGSYCEYFGLDGKPLFEHEDWLNASEMKNGVAWVGVADDEIETYEGQIKYRSVKEYHLIDKTGKVLKTTKGTPVDNGVDISDILYDNDYIELRDKLKEKGFVIAGDFHDGLALAFGYEDYKYGYVNESCELVIPAEYDDAEDFVNGVALVQKDGKWGVINTEGNALTDFVYSNSSYNMFSDDGHVLLAKELEADYYVRVVLDTKGNECELPFECKLPNDAYIYIYDYKDGWFLVERNSEPDENGNRKKTFCLINWNKDTIELPDPDYCSYGIGANGIVCTNGSNRRFFCISSSNALGDPNGDGNVDASDASLILAEYAKMSTGGASDLTDEEKNPADVNTDGLIDSTDASLILEYYAYVSTGGTDTADMYFSKEQDIE